MTAFTLVEVSVEGRTFFSLFDVSSSHRDRLSSPDCRMFRQHLSACLHHHDAHRVTFMVYGDFCSHRSYRRFVRSKTRS
jgi:hypothetical protein